MEEEPKESIIKHAEHAPESEKEKTIQGKFTVSEWQGIIDGLVNSVHLFEKYIGDDESAAKSRELKEKVERMLREAEKES